MTSRRSHLVAKHFRAVAVLLTFTCAISVAVAFQPLSLAGSLQDTSRTIVSDDFTRSRPKGKVRRKPARKSNKAPDVVSPSGQRYRLASSSSKRPDTEFALSTASQVGLTIWKLRRAKVADSQAQRPSMHKSTEPAWIAERVEADTEFLEGDYLRLSIESPRAGYLYVIDRDWFREGDVGETNLIFPLRGDDNRLRAGKLIDIPGQTQAPFQARPKANQLGEILTIIVTTSPLELPISDEPLPISNSQLREWEARWGGSTKHFELENGAGQTRTTQEQQAAARKGTRQLTREDPPPQTIFVLAARNRDAILFNVNLAYGR
jgi:hypothetical protein